MQAVNSSSVAVISESRKRSLVGLAVDFIQETDGAPERRGCYRVVRKVLRAAGSARARAGTHQSQKPQPKSMRARWKAMTAT